MAKPAKRFHKEKIRLAKIEHVSWLGVMDETIIPKYVKHNSDNSMKRYSWKNFKADHSNPIIP